MNGWEQLEIMRDMIGEATAAHWSDRELLSNLNIEQRKLAFMIGKAPGDWLTKSDSVTPVASVIDLPIDCAKVVYLEETVSGAPISWNVNISERRVSRLGQGSFALGNLEAYPLMDQVVINQDSYTTACTLWYQIRVPDLHVGTASTGAATSITLDDNDGAGVSSGGFGAKKIADYYNGVGLVCTGGTGVGTVDTITDYTAARVATVTGTYDNTSIYGTVSMLPEESHTVMLLGAVLKALAKPSSAIDPKYFEYYRTEYKEAKAEFVTWISTRWIGSKRTRVTEVE